MSSEESVGGGMGMLLLGFILGALVLAILIVVFVAYKKKRCCFKKPPREAGVGPLTIQYDEQKGEALSAHWRDAGGKIQEGVQQVVGDVKDLVKPV